MSNSFTLSTDGHETLVLKKNHFLSEQLDATTSPILFGCRTGICGTCIINIVSGDNFLNPPSDDEKELLEIMAEDIENPRLACQLKPEGDISVEYIGK